MTDEDRFAPFDPDHHKMRVDGLVRRVESERYSRVDRLFPIERRLEMIAASIVETDRRLTTDERRFCETAASGLVEYVKTLTTHRLAADSLIKIIRQPGADLNKIIPTADGWWPDA